MYCLYAITATSIWRTRPPASRAGIGRARFYSTPAVAYGRVYIGNTDDKVYSF